MSIAAGLLCALLAALVWPAVARPTGDDDDGHKLYTATVTAAPAAPEDDVPADPAAEIWAGATPTIAITLTNTTTRSQKLGSADIGIPPGLTALAGTTAISSTQTGFAGSVALSGSVLRLRGLGLARRASVTVRVQVRAACAPAAASYVITTAAKQSNDFNGTGNDFSRSGGAPTLDIAGACSLAFVTQPASAQRETDITGDTYLPFGGTPPGAPVTVQVRDGSGTAPVTWWGTPVSLSLAANPGATSLHGTVSVTPVAGLATFRDTGAPEQGPRLPVSASGYRLSASSAGIAAASAPSSSFDIVDVGRRCTAGLSCPGASSTSRTSATVDATATTTGDILRLSLGAIGTPAPVCAGYSPTTDTLDFDLTTAAGVSTGGRRTIVMTLLAPYVTRHPSTYDACFQSTLPFITRSGAPAVASGGYYTGLLPDCSCRPPATGPCEVRTVKDAARNIVMTISAPPGDPRARF